MCVCWVDDVDPAVFLVVGDFFECFIFGTSFVIGNHGCFCRNGCF